MASIDLFVSSQLDVASLLHLQVHAPKSLIVEFWVRTAEISLSIFFYLLTPVVFRFNFFVYYAFSTYISFDICLAFTRSADALEHQLWIQRIYFWLWAIAAFVK